MNLTDTNVVKSWTLLDTPITNLVDVPQKKDVVDAVNNEIDKYKQMSKFEYSDDITSQNGNQLQIPEQLGNPYWINDFKSYFSKAQKWVGHIIEIKENSFTAKLEDLINPTTHEIAEFDFDEISPGDKEYISLGSIFYWSVGRAMNNGQITKQSIIRFQRVIQWGESDYNSAFDRANDLADKFNW